MPGRNRSVAAALRRRCQGRRAVLLGIAAVFAAAGAASLEATDALRRIELETVDLRFAVRGEQRPPADVIVVGIDDETFAELNVQWPFRRGMHARVMDRLAADGAKLIAYDVQFTEPSPFPREDEKLLAAASRHASRLVLATTDVDERAGTRVLGDGRAFEDIGGRVGNAVLPADANAVRRRVPYAVQGLQSFAVAAVEQGTGRRVEREPFGDRGAYWASVDDGDATLCFTPYDVDRAADDIIATGYPYGPIMAANIRGVDTAEDAARWFEKG